MSPEPEVVAALLGVVVGVLSERIARAIGRLRCVAQWDATVLARVSDGEGGKVSEEPERAEDAGWADYRLDVDLFNGKEVPTGLRDLRVELVRGDGEVFTSRPMDLGTAQKSKVFGVRYEGPGVVNLPPRQFVRKELQGSFGREAAVALASGAWRRVALVGERPGRSLLGRRTFRKTVARP